MARVGSALAARWVTALINAVTQQLSRRAGPAPANIQAAEKWRNVTGSTSTRFGYAPKEREGADADAAAYLDNKKDYLDYPQVDILPALKGRDSYASSCAPATVVSTTP